MSWGKAPNGRLSPRKSAPVAAAGTGDVDSDVPPSPVSARKPYVPRLSSPAQSSSDAHTPKSVKLSAVTSPSPRKSMATPTRAQLRESNSALSAAFASTTAAAAAAAAASATAAAGTDYTTSPYRQSSFADTITLSMIDQSSERPSSARTHNIVKRNSAAYVWRNVKHAPTSPSHAGAAGGSGSSPGSPHAASATRDPRFAPITDASPTAYTDFKHTSGSSGGSAASPLPSALATSNGIKHSPLRHLSFGLERNTIASTTAPAASPTTAALMTPIRPATAPLAATNTLSPPPAAAASAELTATAASADRSTSPAPDSESVEIVSPHQQRTGRGSQRSPTPSSIAPSSPGDRKSRFDNTMPLPLSPQLILNMTHSPLIKVRRRKGVAPKQRSAVGVGGTASDYSMQMYAFVRAYSGLPPELCRLVARYGMARSVLLLVGGHDDTHGKERRLNTVEMFDCDRGVWSSLPPLKFARETAALCQFGQRVYAFGGEDARGLMNSIERLNLTHYPVPKWDSNLPPLLSRRSAAHALVVHDKIYCVGGHTGSGGHSIDIFDPKTRTWVEGPHPPRPIPEGASAIVVAGQADAGKAAKIYIFGGYTRGTTERLSSVLSYQISTGKWREEQRMKLARCWSVANWLNGQIYVAGGDTIETAQSLEVYDLRSKRFVLFLDQFYQPPRLYADMVVIADKLIIIGGRTAPTAKPLLSMISWDPVQKIVTDLPPLRYDRRNFSAIVINS